MKRLHALMAALVDHVEDVPDGELLAAAESGEGLTATAQEVRGLLRGALLGWLRELRARRELARARGLETAAAQLQGPRSGTVGAKSR